MMIKKAKKRKLKIMSVQKPVEDNTVQIIDYIPPTNDNKDNNTIEVLDNDFNSDDNSDDENDNYLKEQFMHKQLSENPVIDIDNDDDTVLLSKNKKNKSDIVIFDDILQKEEYLYNNIFK